MSIPTDHYRPGPGGRTPVGDAVVGSSLLVGVMWVLEFVDQLTRNRLDAFGIQAHDWGDLWSVFTAPFMHAGWAHLAGNSLPLCVFAFVILLSGGREFWRVFFISAVVSGVAAWLLSPVGSNTLGASGVIFGMLTYLLLRGIYTRRPGQIALAVMIFLVFGGLLWGVLPSDPHVSWQGHLGGAIGGLIAARSLRRR